MNTTVKFEGTRQLQHDLLVHLGAVSLGFLAAGQGQASGPFELRTPTVSRVHQTLARKATKHG
jgi:hypothetical protein